MGAKGCCRGGGYGLENRPVRRQSEARRTFQKLSLSERVGLGSSGFKPGSGPVFTYYLCDLRQNMTLFGLYL